MRLKQIKPLSPLLLEHSFLLFILRENRLLLRIMALWPSLVSQSPRIPAVLRQTVHKMNSFWSRHCLAEQKWLLSPTWCFLYTFCFWALSIVLFSQWGYTELYYGNKWSQRLGSFMITKFIYYTCYMPIMGQFRLCFIILK